MKQFSIKFPKAKANDFVKFTIEKEIRVILSWEEDGNDFFFAEPKVVAKCVVAEDKANDVLTSDWKQFIQPN